MPADLRSSTMFRRRSLVVLDDCLVKLEHGRTEDRVRKFMFDSVARLVIWRRVPWGRVTACVLCLLLPGALLAWTGELAFVIPGVVLLAAGAYLLLVYFVCQMTTIRLGRADGSADDVTGIFWPGRLGRFRTRLIDAVLATQA